MTYELVTERPNLYIYPWYIAELAHTKDMKEVFGVAVEEGFFVIRRGVASWYFHIESSDEVGRVFLDKIVNNQGFFKEVVDKIYFYADELMKFCSRVDKLDESRLSDLELLRVYEEYVKHLKLMRVWGAVPVYLDGVRINYLSDYLIKILKEYLVKINKEDKLNEYYAILSASEKSSEVQREELARINLILEIRGLRQGNEILDKIKQGETEIVENDDVVNLCRQHIIEYAWLPYGYSGPVMTMDYLLELIRDNLSKKDSVEKQKENLENHYFDVISKKKEIIDSKIPEDLRYISGVSSELMFMKDWRKGIYQKSYVSMDKIMNEISKRLGLSLREVKYLSYDEIELVLIKKEFNDYRERVKQRMEECCYVVKDGNIKIFEGEECKKIIREKVIAKTEDFSAMTELKGFVAYRGNASAIAKIILTKEDIPKLKEGEILVSSATNPDLILAMKKASAFVTDTGGITSHASIVARELKKPCVIGTKFATRVIKDGDLVEVDAEKGVVRIIKKNGN